MRGLLFALSATAYVSHLVLSLPTGRLAAMGGWVVANIMTGYYATRKG